MAKVKKTPTVTGVRNKAGKAKAPVRGTRSSAAVAERGAKGGAAGTRRAAKGKPKPAKATRKAKTTSRKAPMKTKGRKGPALTLIPGRKGRPAAPAPVVRVAVRELDPQRKCGTGTSVQFLYRVDETVDGRATAHLVFFDRHGWYCEHGRTCPAVAHARKHSGQIARVS